MEPTIKIVEDIERNGFSVCDNFISISETEVLLSKIKTLQEQNLFRQAGIGNKDLKQTNSEIRKDKVLWLEKGDQAIDNFFFTKIEDLITGLNRAFYLGINDHEFHLAHYAAGAFYKRHKDVFKSDDARKISVILYLNQDWKKGNGGELKLYPPAAEENSEKTIEPVAGRLVVFESHIEHEVLESKTDRYSITGWLKNKSRLF